MQKPKRVIGYWILTYFIVTAIGVLHTVVNVLVFHMPGLPENASSMYDSVGYSATVPWHILYNIIIWPIMGVLYLKKVASAKRYSAAFYTGLVWALMSLTIDTLGWVVIPHPLHMTASEFFVDYQPWITLIYLSIFVAPLISLIWYNRRGAKKSA